MTNVHSSLCMRYYLYRHKNHTRRLLRENYDKLQTSINSSLKFSGKVGSIAMLELLLGSSDNVISNFCFFAGECNCPGDSLSSFGDVCFLLCNVTKPPVLILLLPLLQFVG